MTVDCTYGLNPQQAEAVINTEGPMLIMAGAGSGKTKVLTCRVANLLQKGVRPYRILAITFTNKAAAEMRERVNNMSGPAAKDVWLFTFHAFCARFLRMEIDKLPGYGGNFAIYDTADSQNLIKQILKEMNLDDKRFSAFGHFVAHQQCQKRFAGCGGFCAPGRRFLRAESGGYLQPLRTETAVKQRT